MVERFCVSASLAKQIRFHGSGNLQFRIFNSTTTFELRRKIRQPVFGSSSNIASLSRKNISVIEVSMSTYLLSGQQYSHRKHLPQQRNSSVIESVEIGCQQQLDSIQYILLLDSHCLFQAINLSRKHIVKQVVVGSDFRGLL